MASWKKVIVSGSIAELSAVSASAFYVQNGQVLTAPASTILSGSFSGSFAGNGANVTGVVTSSYALTASYALNVPATASYALKALNADTASYVVLAQTASYVLQAVSASYASNALSASYAATSSYANNFTVAGTLTAQTIVVQTITSSIAEITGSTQFGSTTANTHEFTGSVSISGSLQVNGSNVITSNQTGSMSVNTASYAVNATTASYALNATTSSYAVNATTASYALNALTASYAVRANSASYADKATQTLNALTLGTGLIGTSFNGSAAVTAAISGAAALSTNVVSKWTGTGFANSNITDTGTQVQIGSGASSGVSVAAGGINVTGNSTFNNDLTVTGNLTVNGSATLVNSTNTYIKDQFIQIASGSTTLTDAGIIAQYNAAGSGSAFFLESSAAGTYGRWAVAYDLLGTVTSAAADEYLVTTKINASAPGAVAPTWGGATNGVGNMWVTTAGDIYIYS